ncbi:hypothetical protein GY12_11280 [Micrococcus luteus]|nr:hypothetical protein GY12_11280 [Micrococcus luteus]
MTSERTTTTGLVRESRRAMRENLRGLPNDSRYTPTAAVWGSASKNCMASLPETSARLPALIEVEIPTPRRLTPAETMAPTAPDWLNRPTGPRWARPGDGEALRRIAGSVRTRPAEAGPITRMPWARARETRRRWASSPSAPASA